MDELIEKTIAFVKRELADYGAGHDFFHVKRVYNNALLIARNEEDVNIQVIELSALLHDVGDAKFTDGDETVGPRKIKTFLESQEVDTKTRDAVLDIITHMSFRKSIDDASIGEKRRKSIEDEIVQDADRLDAIGAIGIARAFEYGGKKGRITYNPDIPLIQIDSAETYKHADGPTINHFYEKLLKLKDMMNTETAKHIAEERHNFMESFLEQFFAEWEGKN